LTKNELTNAVNARLAETSAALAKLDDETALDVTVLFPAWAVGKAYAVDERIRYGGKLYKCVQSHTSQADWAPDVTPALWTEVAKPGQGDSPSSPIPYSGSMALVSGKYYSQDGVTYRCTRDTVNPVYAALKDLVGLYVELVG
jgi:hypothetical protein